MNEDHVRSVSALSNYHVIDIACGESHTIALTNKGEIYTWGGGQLGQLGHGDFLRQSLPIKVANLEGDGIGKVISISCGKRHSAAIT
jgi:RCC1 and BTB domain-containing protein